MPLIVALAIICLFCTPVYAQQNAARAVAACDRLAASDMDPERPASVPGVPSVVLNGEAALRACTVAVKAEPRNARILFQFGRALSAVRRNEEARKALQLAVSLGSKSALEAYAGALEQGVGGPRDLPQARKLYEKAAAAGYATAMSALGRMYANGTGVLRSVALAQRWDEQAVRGLEKLAVAGSPEATYLLAQAYRDGRGVPADAATATQFLTLAAKRGHPAAMLELGERAEDNRDFAKARDWYVQAGKVGHTPSMIKLGMLYEDGRAGSRQPAIAKRLYELAAAQGDRSGEEQLARLRNASR